MRNKENIIALSQKVFYRLKQEESNFPKDNIYYIGETYSASYLITRVYKQALRIRLETKFSDEITLCKVNNDDKVVSEFLTRGKETKFTICFKPTSLYLEKERSFAISASVPGYESNNQGIILEKKFTIKDKLVKKSKIDAVIGKALPTSIKLGQKAEAIFIFTNNGDQPVHGINIEVVQLEA